MDVAAPAEAVFAAVVDWPSQGAWMLGTSVRATASGADGVMGEGVGAELAAFTGVGRLGFLDTMRITRWEHPHRVDVVHTGKVVRGTGTMLVEPLSATSSRFVWSEDIELPLGALGRLGWRVVGPLFGRGIVVSLRRFADFVVANRS